MMATNEATTTKMPFEKNKGRRLNRFPIIILCTVIAVILIVVAYSYQKKVNDMNAPGKVDDSLNKPASSSVLFGDVPIAGEIGARDNTRVSKTNKERQSSETNKPGGMAVKDTQQKQRSRYWDYYEQEMLKAQQMRYANAQSAIYSKTTVDIPDSKNKQLAQEVNSPTTRPVANNPANGQSSNDDFNGQQAKRDFLKQKADKADYLGNTRIPALSKFEVKAGTIIPGIMIGGINSDLPGEILGQVRENVYDTVTGQYLLIPQGSRLLGIYDNGVTMGQERVLIAWTRIIYPDGSSLNLNLMPGTDTSGYAGFNDQVNNHYMRTFGTAILMSVISAGVQLSQPQASNGDNYNNSQIMAGALGQQLSQVGAQTVQQNMRIQPTLEIRNGYKFNIMVNKDIILEPYVGH